ncbi:MAG: putative isocitrate lyase/carboxyphosphonoenolpyruvate phosphonomutase [Deltaproteobacteria bacterium]|nr:putative isocitrate lyase/carboxyphosphonoenolpyruvate phosphonomutase [Deltaproteobacteria bacterium]
MRTQAQRIRDLVNEHRPLVMGGVYDGISTRIATRVGFEVLFMGGFSVAATLLGEPDFGYLTQTEMADTARRVCRLTDRPLLVDADTGYGNALNVVRTVELFQAAGAAGLFLEDQVWPKRCGHMRGKRVVERAEWLTKLRAVLETRGEHDLFLVARTDARAAISLDEAIARGKAAHDLGVDAVFIEAPESVAELERIGRAIPGPKVANMLEHGKTPLLAPGELHQLGFDLIVTPLAALMASAKAVQEIYALLRAEGSLRNHLDRLMPFDDFNQLVELDRHYQLEARFKSE